ncbi:ABC transporter ATP-binding protein [Eubacterium sp. 1001713B170207_170306_E7]|uniref:ABC transporter ATP-binding protein n=1 Tax=Eubacterium sp. 1001713B170207_170306_E7 TaxID=2787097 RepID=UPI001899D428|nr:ABC transporter ATP-binding protein [Eubacterium sp. 1001713B170207_170306_E7]
MSVLLNAQNLTKYYDKNQPPALDHVSFKVASGEFLGIMGASGSGKTTLLNVLSTIDVPSEGRITLGGVDIQDLKDNAAADFRRDRLGFIFQEYFLLDSLTVQENIAVPLTLIGTPAHKVDTMVRKLAARFGIASFLNKYPAQLSGGQRQRTAAARALVKNPAILFADEPTGALDSASAAALLTKLSEVNVDLKTTILMVTHDAYAASFANRILIFKDGRIVRALHRKDQTPAHFHSQILAAVSALGQ